MKVIASILCICLLGLCIQPAVFPMRASEAKEMSCCVHKHKTGTKKDCCNNNACDPFCNICPVCAANALAVKKYLLPENEVTLYISPKYFSKNEFFISNYQADILRPPQAV